MRNTTSVLENETHKLLWDFNKETDHIISARRPDLILIHKKKKRRVKLKENEKKDKYNDFASD